MYIERIFYPIGQGAFYAEKHKHINFNIVYDCGELYCSRKAKQIVTNSFSKNDIINILFISHFDYDHISLIPLLKDTVKHIKCVVIPYLFDEEKIMLSNFYKCLGVKREFINLIKSPENFFGENTLIIKVRPIITDVTQEIKNDENIYIDEISNKGGELVINSGTILNVNNKCFNWVYVPYNFKYDKQKSIFENLLKIEFQKYFKDFNINYLKDINFINKVIKNRELRKKIKKIYNELEGDINSNSLVVYSGPFNLRRCKFFLDICFLDIYFNEKKPIFVYTSTNCQEPGCIFTGDANLNTINLKNYFGKFWRYISTIQIPHHGSKRSFSDNFLGRKRFICPLSFGVNNPFGHPYKEVIDLILEKGSIPIFVTNKTGFKEIVF